MRGQALIVLLSGICMLIIAMGTRQSFGIFVPSMSMDLDVGRQVLGLALALQQLLWGVCQPVIGLFADRWGSVRIGIAGGVIYALGLFMTYVWADPVTVQFSLGIMIGIALSGTTYGTVLGAVGRMVPPEKRTQAFGICTAAGSFGMFAVVPGAQYLLDTMGWSGAFLVFSVLAALMIPLSFGLKTPLPPQGQGFGADLGPTIRTALTNRSYWLLNAGFFVCGFHVAFVAVHLPSYLRDNNMAGSVTAWALAMIGLFNIIGSYLFGQLGARFSQKYLLSMVYGARGIVIILFLALPLSPITAIAFGGAMGFLWLSTVPLTSGLVARMFGICYMAMLYGFVFMFHQIGAFLGAYGGGWAYDHLGSYDLIWYFSIALAILAAIVHLPIAEKAVPLRGAVGQAA